MWPASPPTPPAAAPSKKAARSRSAPAILRRTIIQISSAVGSSSPAPPPLCTNVGVDTTFEYPLVWGPFAGCSSGGTNVQAACFAPPRGDRRLRGGLRLIQFSEALAGGSQAAR